MFIFHSGIYSEIDQTMSSLETLAKVFDHPSCPLTCPKIQVNHMTVLKIVIYI